MDRRTFVVGVSTGVTTGLAGCAGEDLDLSPDTGADSDDDAESDRRSEAAAEAATEDFLQALADGDAERQGELVHDDATGFSTSTDEYSLTINEVASHTIAEIAEQHDESISESEIEDANQRLQDRTNEIGADDSAQVYFDIDVEDDSEEGYLFLVEDDGEWLIYDDGIGVELEADDTEPEDSPETTPEAATEDFLQALADGDAERQEELLHQEATGFSTSTEEITLTIHEVASHTIAEIAEQHGESISESEIEDAKDSVGERITEIGATDYAHVYYEFETEQFGTEEGYLFVVQDGGEWLIYDDGIGVELEDDEETQQEVSNRLQIQSAVGNVTEDETVDEVRLTVAKAPGSDAIDLEAVSYQFDTNDSSVLSADQISVIVAETDDTEITDRADRYQLSFTAPTHFDSELDSGDRLTIDLTTASGASTVKELRVPDSLVDRDAVVL